LRCAEGFFAHLVREKASLSDHFPKRTAKSLNGLRKNDFVAEERFPQPVDAGIEE
jgi:hypothetical protein